MAYTTWASLSEAAQVDKAIDAFEGALNEARATPTTSTTWARRILRRNTWTRRKRRFKKATELDPKLFKAQWRLGLVSFSKTP